MVVGPGVRERVVQVVLVVQELLLKVRYPLLVVMVVAALRRVVVAGVLIQLVVPEVLLERQVPPVHPVQQMLVVTRRGITVQPRARVAAVQVARVPVVRVVTIRQAVPTVAVAVAVAMVAVAVVVQRPTTAEAEAVAVVADTRMVQAPCKQQVLALHQGITQIPITTAQVWAAMVQPLRPVQPPVQMVEL